MSGRITSTLIAALALASCQTTTSADQESVSRLAGRLQVVPQLMKLCETIDPPNAVSYAEERIRYERENRWVSDATYRAMERRIPSTRQGLESFVSGVAGKKVTEALASFSDGDLKKGCLKALSQCRLRERSCGPVEQLEPDLVRQVVSEATK